jgi:aminoglycoside phosphotransferase (APT) family kinase protein
MSGMPIPPLDKDRPTIAWIEQLRKRYPCETELDRVLTRKLLRRAGPPYSPLSVQTLVDAASALIRNEVEGAFDITESRWLSGGASKLQMAFNLNWNQPGVGRASTPMVLRMEPPESITETSRRREFQIIRAMAGCVPVPRTYWVDAEGTYLPYPAIIYGLCRGVTKPTAASSGVTGVGTKMPSLLRKPLGAQYVEHLAKIHTFDWLRADLTAFDKPARGTQAVEWQLNRWERVWEEDANEDVPLMRLAMAWLRDNMPVVDTVSVVHGDYRVGNFLFTEEDNEISAWLDWELSYLGDRHEDLAWATKEIFGHTDEGGKVFLVGGFLPRDQFFAAYEKASGLSVNMKTLRYYNLLSNYKSVAICLATGYRAPRNGKTHQDVLVAWLAGISYMLLDELRTQLEEVL